MVFEILDIVPCSSISSSACLGTRKLSAPAQNRSEVVAFLGFYFPIYDSSFSKFKVLTEREKSDQHSDDQQLIHDVACLYEERINWHLKLTPLYPLGWDIVKHMSTPVHLTDLY